MPSKPKRRVGVRKLPAPAVEYAAGHFTAMIRKHDWPKGFVPTEVSDDTRAKHLQSQAIRARLEGKGWALGTIRLCGTPTYKPPGDM